MDTRSDFVFSLVLRQTPMADLFDLCHSRWALAALVVDNVSHDTLDTVTTRYNRGRISPTNIHLDVVQAPELLSQEPERAKNYVRENFSHPDSPLIPCFFTVIDNRTAQDGSILYVQQDWAGELCLNTPTSSLPGSSWAMTDGSGQHARSLQPYAARPHSADGEGHRAFPRFTRQPHRLRRRRCQVVRAGPSGRRTTGVNEARTVKQVRREDGTFGDNLYLKVYQRDILSPFDNLRVWGTSYFFRWGVDSAL